MMVGDMKLDEKVGICIKNSDSEVTHQNDICIKLCGDRQKQKCQDGCMTNYHLDAPIVINEGMKLIKNSPTPHGKADAVVINDGNEIITLLYDLERKEKNIKLSLEEIKECDLSKSEMTIMELILQGLSKKEIMKKLFVSEATIKTHINNIYKKLPEKWQLLKNRREK